MLFVLFHYQLGRVGVLKCHEPVSSVDLFLFVLQRQTDVFQWSILLEVAPDLIEPRFAGNSANEQLLYTIPIALILFLELRTLGSLKVQLGFPENQFLGKQALDAIIVAEGH